MGIHRYPSISSPVATVLKLIVAFALVIVTISLVFFANDMISVSSPSWFLQLASAGAIILAMSWLSIQIFRGLEYV